MEVGGDGICLRLFKKDVRHGWEDAVPEWFCCGSQEYSGLGQFAFVFCQVKFVCSIGDMSEGGSKL
jgi:hypothetical protein